MRGLERGEFEDCIILRKSSGPCYNSFMIAALKSIVPAIEAWPDEDQARLVEAARMIAAERRGTYHASAEELDGIDRGLIEADHGRFASNEKLAATLAAFRAA